MNQALSTFVPLYAFMLLPVWIPMIAVSVGWVLDRFGSGEGEGVAARVATAKEHSRARHAVEVPVALPDAA